MYSQSEIKRFLQDEVLGKMSFNEHSESGAHTTFISRAAQAAGLEVRKIEKGHYFFQGKQVVGSVESMITSLCSHASVEICRSKLVMKELMSARGVPVPEGQAFPKNERANALRFFSSLKSPAVVKPDKGRGGVGITAGIQTPDEFRDAWSVAYKNVNSSTPIVVERFVPGLDLRVYVVRGKVVAASTRVPPFVVGNGKSTISELLSEKQEQRNRNRYLSRLPIVISEPWIAHTGKALSTVLPDNEIALLSSTANMSQGGENIDVTASLSPEIADIAIHAIGAVPGMQAGGVDFQAPSPYDAKNAVVLEVNAVANISVHHLPAYGRRVDVGRSIVAGMLEATVQI